MIVLSSGQVRSCSDAFLIAFRISDNEKALVLDAQCESLGQDLRAAGPNLHFFHLRSDFVRTI